MPVEQARVQQEEEVSDTASESSHPAEAENTDADDDVILKKGTSKTATSLGSTTADQDAEAANAFDFHYTVFSILFMIGFMLHTRKYYTNEPFICFGHILSYCFLKAYRPLIFLTFLSYMIYSWYDILPEGANHHNVAGYLSLVLWPQQVLQVCASSGVSQATKQAATTQTLNVVRLLIVVLYFMAGFHKVNTDFLFEPSVSCAYSKIWQYLQVLGIDADDLDKETLPWYLVPLPLGVLIKEFLPPVLLLWKGKPQGIALCMLLLLHLILLPVGFADFGSIANSLLWLFVAPTQAMQGLPLHHYVTHAVLFVALEGMARIQWEIQEDGYAQDGYGPWTAQEATMVFFAYTLIWVNLFRVTRVVQEFDGVSIHKPSSKWGYAAVGVFLVWTLSPYLGVRTSGCLSMFSNLRTEGPRSNHLILRNNPLKIFGLADDIVTIVHANHKWKGDKLIYEGARLNKVIFDRKMREELYEGGRNVGLTIDYQGHIYETEDLNSDATFDDFRRPEAYWVKKFLDFRQILPDDEPQECLW